MKRGTSSVLVVLVALHVLTFTAFASVGGGSSWTIFGFFSNLFDILSAVLEALLEGIKYLFIPSPDYFTRLWDVLHDAFSTKFGGVFSIITYLGERFASMKVRPDLDNLFILRFPQGSLLGGVSINLIYGGINVLSMIRGVFSGFIILVTVSFCYKKVVAMINS